MLDTFNQDWMLNNRDAFLLIKQYKTVQTHYTTLFSQFI